MAQRKNETMHRWLWLAAITAIVVGGTIALYFTPGSFMDRTFVARSLQRLNLVVQDRFVAAHPRPEALDDVVFLGIDQSSLRMSEEDTKVVEEIPALKAMAGNFPWSRSVWAAAIERLVDSGGNSWFC